MLNLNTTKKIILTLILCISVIFASDKYLHNLIYSKIKEKDLIIEEMLHFNGISKKLAICLTKYNIKCQEREKLNHYISTYLIVRNYQLWDLKKLNNEIEKTAKIGKYERFTQKHIAPLIIKKIRKEELQNNTKKLLTHTFKYHLEIHKTLNELIISENKEADFIDYVTRWKFRKTLIENMRNDIN